MLDTILITGEKIPGYKVKEVLSVISSSNKGEETNTEDALKRLAEGAKKVGADAVIGVRFEVSNIRRYNFKVFAYGTAVKLEKE